LFQKAFTILFQVFVLEDPVMFGTLVVEVGYAVSPTLVLIVNLLFVLKAIL